MRTAVIAFAVGTLAATSAFSQAHPLLAAPAAQADAPPADPSTLVSGIEVQAPSAKALRAFAAAAEKFTRAQGQPGQAHQLSRWTRRLCPQTFGLRQDFGALVSNRIKAVAEDVGAAVPGACRGTNVLVVFTSQPDAMMADVRDHHPILLGSHYIDETPRLAAFEPPMKSWYVTLTAVAVYSTATKTGPERQVLDNAYGQEQPNCTQIRACTLDKMRTMKSEFGFALVVVDARLIVGRPIGPIADEVAMRVLSKAAAKEGCSPLPSIMDLLDAACPASQSGKGLTAYDKAYLKALYGPHDTEILAYDRARIERAVQAVGLSPADEPAVEAQEAAATGADQRQPPP